MYLHIHTFDVFINKVLLFVVIFEKKMNERVQVSWWEERVEFERLKCERLVCESGASE